MKCLAEKEMENECDRNGDNRDGWPNCSVCGETDLESLFKKKFTREEVMDLITQNEGLMEKLAEIESTHFTANYSSHVDPKTGFLYVSMLISDKVMSYEEIETEVANQDPFEPYLGDKELLVINLVEKLNTKKRMELFLMSHDFIFHTQWLLRYHKWLLETKPSSYREHALNVWVLGDMWTEVVMEKAFGEQETLRVR